MMQTYEPNSGMDWKESQHLEDGIYAMKNDAMGQVWLRTDRDESLPHVIGFEYQTIQNFTSYLFKEYPEEMGEIVDRARPSADEDPT